MPATAGSIPFQTVVSTAELQGRTQRPPDYEAENTALVSLAREMASSSRDILQRLVEVAMTLCGAGSCGVSIVEDDGGAGLFRWHAMTGALSKTTQLLTGIDDHFKDFEDVEPAITEALLVPFAVAGQTVGTLWVLMHEDQGHFDAEHARVLRSLGDFASAAYRMKISLEQTQAADRRKDDFLATLGHELRNPLAALQSATYYIGASLGDADGNLRKASEVQKRQVKAMTRMVGDLLDVSRIARHKLQLHRERIVLTSVVLDAVEMNRVLMSNAGQQLTVDMPAEPMSIDADPTRLTQVVANLLHNAVKFTPRNGQIALAAAVEDRDLVIRVSDDGMGIAPAMLVKIFEPFAQVESSRDRAQGGLGIGLSLVRHLTELHGGTVRAHSNGEGLGSVFTVRLPGVVLGSCSTG